MLNRSFFFALFAMLVLVGGLVPSTTNAAKFERLCVVASTDDYTGELCHLLLSGEIEREDVIGFRLALGAFAEPHGHFSFFTNT